MDTPIENIQVDAATNRVTVSVNEEVYPLEVIYGAGFVFVDRAYVLLDRGEEGYVRVALTARAATDESGLQGLGGEFGNELLAQALRDTISRRTQKIRELVINRALYSTMEAAGGGGAELDLEEEDDLEFLDDPLGIAVPWEDKFEGDGKKDGAEAASAEAASDDSGEPVASEPAAEAAEGGDAPKGESEP